MRSRTSIPSSTWSLPKEISNLLPRRKRESLWGPFSHRLILKNFSKLKVIKTQRGIRHSNPSMSRLFCHRTSNKYLIALLIRPGENSINKTLASLTKMTSIWCWLILWPYLVRDTTSVTNKLTCNMSLLTITTRLYSRSTMRMIVAISRRSGSLTS